MWQFLCAIAVMAGILHPATGSARVLYVNQAVENDAGDGSEWASAYRTLTAALDIAKAGDEIWVAGGTYRPSDANDRRASFALIEGVGVYGGFAGDETERSARAWRLNETILSGDIGVPGDWRDNSFHVVVGADDAVLDGVTVAHGTAIPDAPPSPRPGAADGQAAAPSGPQAGAADRQGATPSDEPIHTTPEAVLRGSGNDTNGGGMLNFRAAPLVRNCIFRDNRAMKAGAVYNMTAEGTSARDLVSRRAARFENCEFRNNLAIMRGGAISNDMETNPTIIQSLFVGNRSGGKGGAIYNDFGCSPEIRDSIFVWNEAFQAAAIGNDGGSAPVIVGSVITHNVAADLGAGLYQGTGPANNPVVVNTIVRDNSAPAGPADIYNWHDNQPQIAGSIVGDEVQKPVPAGEIAAMVKELTARAREVHEADIAAAKTHDISAAPVYVDAASNAADPDGSSWASAFRDLQSGIDAAAERAGSVWLAAGIYTPRGDGRHAAFRLKPGVAVYGGFTGSETSLDARDWEQNITVLSGDIGARMLASDNAYHVFVGANGARLDGVTVTAGNADGSGYDSKGGGLVNYADATQMAPFSPTITGFSMALANCVFDGNEAQEGGALYSYNRAQVSISNCRFTDNSAGFGGAIVDRVGVVTKMTDVAFEGNRARWSGGAYFVDYGARPVLSNASFIDNEAGADGGAIYTISRASQLEASIVMGTELSFKGNRAGLRGGGIAATDSSIVRIDGCSMISNVAMAGGAGSQNYDAQLVVKDCRMSNNRASKGEADVDRGGYELPAQ
ncbi:MAG: DUF1565 domain-containing protein [Alphaproteobacteria bacterium]|nr:DUF1565 domain-containing protein [Alphaproteobacteria bacterium]